MIYLVRVTSYGTDAAEDRVLLYGPYDREDANAIVNDLNPLLKTSQSASVVEIRLYDAVGILNEVRAKL